MTDHPDHARSARLRQFILLDVLTTLIAAGAMAVINVAFVRDPWLLVATFLVIGAGATMAMGLRPLRAGSMSGSVWWLAAGNWGIAVAAAAIATFSWPIQVLAALLPAVASVSYVSRREVRLILAISVVVAVAAGVVGLVQDFTGLTDALPGWVPPTVLIMFLPFMAVLIAQAGAAAAASLREALDEALAINDQLRASESALADQADLVRESRARLVAAADRERRRIERDLHDGAQQRLVGLSLQMAEARRLLRDDPDGAEVALARARDEVRLVQAEMRSLVRGLYPPVLTEHGVAAAVRAVLGQLRNPVRAEMATNARFDVDIEAALYFCGCEALQNIAKHAGDEAVVTMSLTQVAGVVCLRISDTGPGFDPAAGARGQGFINMRDRIGATGGELTVDSAPGGPTVVAATVPLRSRDLPLCSST